MRHTIVYGWSIPFEEEYFDDVTFGPLLNGTAHIGRETAITDFVNIFFGVLVIEIDGPDFPEPFVLRSMNTLLIDTPSFGSALGDIIQTYGVPHLHYFHKA